MEIDCFHCKSTIRLNIHRAEVIVILLNFGTIVALAVSAFLFPSRVLIFLALGAAMAGSLALPLIERIFLRNWPRYAPTVDSTNP